MLLFFVVKIKYSIRNKTHLNEKLLTTLGLSDLMLRPWRPHIFLWSTFSLDITIPKTNGIQITKDNIMMILLIFRSDETLGTKVDMWICSLIGHLVPIKVGSIIFISQCALYHTKTINQIVIKDPKLVLYDLCN